MTNKKYYFAVPVMLSACVLASCSSNRYPTAIEQAQVDVLGAQRDVALMTHAPMVVAESASTLRHAEEVWRSSGNEDEVDHLVYLVERRLRIAEEKSREQASQSLTREELQRGHLAARRLEYDSQLQQERLGRLEENSAKNRADLRDLQADANRTALNQSGIVAYEGRNQFTLASDMLFESDSAELKSGALLKLSPVMGKLAKESSRAILIEGYTDNIGLFTNNQALSQRRAEAVAGVLVDYGIDASRISCKGLGEEFPILSNYSEAGRLQNRRVRIVLADY